MAYKKNKNGPNNYKEPIKLAVQDDITGFMIPLAKAQVNYRGVVSTAINVDLPEPYQFNLPTESNYKLPFTRPKPIEAFRPDVLPIMDYTPATIETWSTISATSWETWTTPWGDIDYT